MKGAIVINVASDFSDYPTGRYISDSPVSGQRFRDEFLIPKLDEAMRRGEKLVVDLDGVQSLGSSFLEEAFGGLVRSQRAHRKAIIESVVIRYSWAGNRIYENMIKRYIANA